MRRILLFIKLILPFVVRAIAIIGIVSLIGNVFIEALPLPNNNVLTTVSIMYRVEQQGALDERIDKDVLNLAYRAQSERVQAVNELQVTLPTFEQIQAGLQNGDASLYLPTRRPQDVQLLVVQSQSDYAAIDTAARSILAHADSPVDANELAIIQQHERPYFLEINDVAKVWESHILENALDFFWFELWIGIGLAVLWITYTILAGKVRAKK